ncbi:MAG: hypothetical protein QOF52_16 [Propionibacteriaceae bacterium]|jgi:hypothetical protein|nr:hypothetical protein [Propionibacteriaceae bacterium]MDX6320158.1 hypothetical protein [Propionibacteriaceae bacterium]
MGPTLDVQSRAAGKGAPSRRRVSSTDVTAVHRHFTGPRSASAATAPGLPLEPPGVGVVATDADLTPSPLHGVPLTTSTSTITRVWSYF